MNLSKISLLLVMFTCISLLSHSQPLVVGGKEVNTVPLLNKSMVSCSPLFSYDTSEPQETGIADAGNLIWTGGAVDNVFYCTNGVTGALVSTTAKPPFPMYGGGGLDYDGSNLWYVNEQQGILYKIDAASGTIANQWNLPNNGSPGDPNNYGIALDDSIVWEAEYLVPVGTGTYLHKYDAPTMTLVDSIFLPNVILAIGIINSELYGAAIDVPYIFHIDRTTGLYLDSIPLCVSMCYGFTTSQMGFWLNGISAISGNPVNLYETLTGMNESISETTKHISFFPNPAKDEITFSSGVTSNTAFRILTATGTVLKSGILDNTSNHPKINIGSLTSGAYFFEIISQSLTTHTKLIKL